MDFKLPNITITTDASEQQSAGGFGDALEWNGLEIKLEVLVKPEDGAADYSCMAKCMWRGEEVKAQFPVWMADVTMPEDKKRKLFDGLLAKAAQSVKDHIQAEAGMQNE